MMDIIIPHPKNFEKKLNQLRQDGAKKLHILTDFDKTLTKAFHKGRKIYSIINILRKKKYLSPDYSKKAYELFNTYHPIEENPNISKLKKKKKIKEWYEKHFDLLIASHLNIRDIEKVISSEKLEIRKGVDIFFKTAGKKEIPIIILSAAGLGKESISKFLKKEKINTQNTYIIANGFVWDKNGYATKVQEPIIHSHNKDEIILKNFYFYKNVKNRKNILLLGNSISDTDMSKGFKAKTVLNIGFMNKNIDQLLPVYKKHFDMIIMNDGNFNKVNKILKEIIG